MEAQWLPFGVLRRPHGTAGEILLHPFNTERARGVAPVPPMQVRLARAQDVSDANLVACRPVRDGFLVLFEGIATREAAGALAGQEVHLPRTAFAPLEGDEFFVADIVGCEAFQPDGQHLGRVAGTYWNGSHDVMTIVAEDGGERLLPVVSEYIRRFERASCRLIVDLHE